MPRDLVVPPESFEEILTWLHPDREVAGAMYVQLRHDLAKLFMWRGCSDPEGLTDEVFDRVRKKVHDVKPGYQGDPRLYFRAVANNVVKEDFKKIKTYASLENVDLSKQQTTTTKSEDENIHECLQLCLQALSNEKRELILSYYADDRS